MMKPGVATISQDKSPVSSTTATALPSRNGKIATTTTVQALNANNVVMNSPRLASAVALGGTPATGTATATAAAAATAAAPAAAAPALTLMKDGPESVVLPLEKGNALSAGFPPASSNAVTQTSFLGTAGSSSSCIVISSSTGKTGPTMALARPPINTAGPAIACAASATQSGNNTAVNSTINARSVPATTAASVATVASGVSLQASLVNSQPESSMPATAALQIIKSESPKTIVQAVSQKQILTTSVQCTTGGSTIRQGRISNPSGIEPSPAPVTSAGKATGTASTVTESVPRTSTATTGGIRVLRLLPQPQNRTGIQKVHLPPGMVLLRRENGQLIMLTQQNLAQLQAQAQTQSQPQNTMTSCPATTSAPPLQRATVQAPGTKIIAQQGTPTTTIKQVSQAQKTVQTTTLQRPPVVQPQIVAGGSAQTSALGTASTVQAATPQMAEQGATTTPAVATEARENGKKCQVFLSALIKLASSGKLSTETAAKIKELVQNLLDGKIEAEDFASRLYQELNSSPKSYLVPFLKKSLPALRQLAPDSAAFIQENQQQQPRTKATKSSPAVVLSNSLQSTAGKTSATVTGSLQPPVRGQKQPAVLNVSKQAQPTPLVIQQPRKPGTLIIRPSQVILTKIPKVALRQPHDNLILTTQQIQLNHLKTIPAAKPPVLPDTKTLSSVSAQAAAAQHSKPKELATDSFGKDDDINDVASMAGVNLSEESARILATNSGLVGTLTRSCQDEAFLLSEPLRRRILEIGKKHGITELHPDVVSYVSRATQNRLQNLIEKVSEIAQHKNISYKNDERYEQESHVRAQLKFFEELGQIEKRRKDEQERDILMRAAKSRSRQEDPEQLRLKQKAKEMQQQELAQKRQRDANLTALEAIGPRKKRRVNSLESGSWTEGCRKSTAVPGASEVATTRQFKPRRITRVNLRDLIFCLENERGTRHSLLLYKAFLK